MIIKHTNPKLLNVRFHGVVLFWFIFTSLVIHISLLFCPHIQLKSYINNFELNITVN